MMEPNGTPVTVVILAAGLGTRMKSRKAKVLHRAGGKALVEHVVETALELAPPERIFVVVGHQAEEVRQAVATPGIGFIEQKEQKGTGHALMVCREALAGLGGYLVIVYGDGPLLRAETLRRADRRRAILRRRRRPALRGNGRPHRLRPRDPRRARPRLGHGGAEGRHARAARDARSQHGDLLLSRGSVLEARGRAAPG